MKALIDGDIIKYQCGFSAEKPIYNIHLKGTDEYLCSHRYKKDAVAWCGEEGLEEDDVVFKKDIEVEPLAFALQATKEKLESIMRETGADDHVIYITGSGNYREELATLKPYKGNRDSSHKPKWFDEIQGYMNKRWNVVVVMGMEADDAMGIDQWKDWKSKWKGDGVKTALSTIICTTDKDLNMIPGYHYNWDKGLKYVVDEDTADLWFYSQLIMGDSTDNIGGIPKAGKKAVEKILDGCETNKERYDAVNEAYRLAYNDIFDGNRALMENANLLWIQREDCTLWKPPV